MTNQRMNLSFDENGICNSCIQFEKSKKTDWITRYMELEKLCRKYRRKDGEYDCIICMSSGKDSHYLVGLYKEMLHMNPLGIMIDNLSWTKTGRLNFDNISETFGIDIITFTPNRKKMKEQVKKDFFESLHPSKYWDEILYRKPLDLAQKLGIRLVIWGENVNITVGNENKKETPNAKILMKDPNTFKDLDVIFTSYFVKWNRYINLELAKKYGFKSLKDTEEWNREGLEGFEFEQVDSIGYLCNQYLKFIKFGFSSQTELCSDAIRHNKMTREQAIKQINENDWKLDKKMLEDFVGFLGINEVEFWKVVDKFANRELIEKRNGMWRLKKDAK